MNNDKIVRAWKDEEFRSGLSEEELAGLPENPAGISEADESELEDVSGGTTTIPCVTATISIVSAALCQSWAGGGSCDQGTSGCCTYNKPGCH